MLYILLILALANKKLHEAPIPETIPFSISTDLMTKTGNYNCKAERICTNPPSNEPCGPKCWYDDQYGGEASFEYTFKGELFQIYGTNDLNHGSFALYVDNMFIQNVSQTSPRALYQLQYTSELLSYGTHTIRVQTIGKDIEIYKFAYWPSVNAIRVNSTDMSPQWNVEADSTGGLREWANKNSHSNEAKSKNLQFSKFWIFGTFDPGHGNFSVTFKDSDYRINEELIINERKEGSRVADTIVYESSYYPLFDYEFEISQKDEDVSLNCIYFLPNPEPTTVPISVSTDQMNITGKHGCGQEKCPEFPNHSSACGKSCFFNDQDGGTTTFEYKFKGEKFEIYGTFDPNHGNYQVLIDDIFITNVSQHGERLSRQHQYTSEDLQYGEHKITVRSVGEDIEIYKFTYWPSIHAVRLNSTDLRPLWNVETDKFGGLRESATASSHSNEPKTATLQFSKLWIYGTFDPNHQDFKLKLNDKEYDVSEHSETRKENTLVYETEFIPFEEYEVSISQYKEGVSFNCIYYLPFPEPTPVPFSVHTSQMQKTGDFKQGSSVQCSNPPNVLRPCGQNIFFDDQSGGSAALEYTFIGEKFQIYGTNDPNHGSYQVFVDNMLAETVSQKGRRLKYQLQYTSGLLSYGKHTIRIYTTQDIEIYKFAYWPSVNAIRVNSTDMSPQWNVEADSTGGLREWARENSHSNEAKSKNLQFSKFWIFGTFDPGHGNFSVTFKDSDYRINEELTINERNEGSRVADTIVYESSYYPLFDYEFEISQKDEDVSLNCIYFLPNPEPTTVPISVSTDQMNITGKHGCGQEKCPEFPNHSSACGKSCFFNDQDGGTTTFEYKFKGEKFEIYGTFDPNHGNYQVLIDDIFITNVSQHGERLSRQHQYTSEDLQYGEHKITVRSVGEDIEIYKFTYWPSIHAVRLNSTDLRPLWNVETDKFGGLRESATASSHSNEPKTATLQFSKLWIYGTGNFKLKLNDKEYTIPKHPGERIENSLAYETEFIPFEKYEVSISQNEEEFLFNSIYYLPFPEPTPVPFSVHTSLMQKSSLFTSSTNVKCSNPPDVLKPCGQNVWYDDRSGETATLEYTFLGERFQIYGTNDPGHGSYEVYVDDVLASTVSQQGRRLKYQLQYTSDVLPYGEHKIKVQTIGKDIEIYKFAYWPSVHALRLNSTQMKPLWNVEADNSGGLREWSNEKSNGFPGVAKEITIEFSKLWIYGAFDQNHGNFLLNINDQEFTVSENIDSGRIEDVFVYETNYMAFEKYKVSIKQNLEDVLLNCFYYLPMPAPTSTPTPTPAQTPQPSPYPFVFDDENCHIDKRCKIIISNNTNHQILVLKSNNFTEFTIYNEQGGAIYIENAGLDCQNNTFVRCTSTGENSCGGAIYLVNAYDFSNAVYLENITFTQCEANYGGAVYLNIKHSSTSLTVLLCHFIGNVAKAAKSDTHNNFGGSAMYVTSVGGDFIDNVFKANKGVGGALKIVNVIESATIYRLNSLFEKEKEVSISGCKFEIDQTADCSLFYFAGKNGAKYTLKNCQFTGILAPDAYYIDGMKVNKKVQELVVLNCRFSSDFKHSFNINQNENLFKININEQIFEIDDQVLGKSEKKNLLLMIAAASMTVVAITVIIAVAVIIKKKKNENINDESEMPQEIKDPLL